MPKIATQDRYILPDENRRVDPNVAHRLRAMTLQVASDLGMDKITAAVVLVDLAVELFAENGQVKYPPEIVREVVGRAVVVHYGGGR